ncbi:MAG: peptidoglycan-binding protein [Flavobacteriaceae bacterium]|nr:MAG: peptidoglycan-binding protein [Flavobacteriaceae bacterium]
MKPKLQLKDFIEAANYLNVDVSTIKAVAEVESGDQGGFYQDGHPVILFEGHYFWELTKGKFGLSNVSHPKWTTDFYRENQKLRLEKAAALDRTAALQSASWGMFQIMGANFRRCGFATVQGFVNAMYKGEKEHLMAFCAFIKSQRLQDELQRKDFAGFASVYNGPRFKKNKYDTKMAKLELKYRHLNK